MVFFSRKFYVGRLWWTLLGVLFLQKIAVTTIFAKHWRGKSVILDKMNGI